MSSSCAEYFTILQDYTHCQFILIAYENIRLFEKDKEEKVEN